MRGPLGRLSSLTSPPPQPHLFLTWSWVFHGDLPRSFLPVNGDEACCKARNANHQVRHIENKDAQMALKDGIEHTLNEPDRDPAGVCRPHHTRPPCQQPVLYVLYLFIQHYVLNTFPHQTVFWTLGHGNEQAGLP